MLFVDVHATKWPQNIHERTTLARDSTFSGTLPPEFRVRLPWEAAFTARVDANLATLRKAVAGLQKRGWQEGN
jgi:hypothetical protein